MTRIQFLTQLWSRIFRPIIILAVIWFCIRFLISVFTENGTSRGLIITVLLLTILFALVHLAGVLFLKLNERIYAKLSIQTKERLRILSKISNYLALPLIGVLLYKAWEKDAVLFSIIVLIFLGDRVIGILKEKN